MNFRIWSHHSKSWVKETFKIPVNLTINEIFDMMDEINLSVQQSSGLLARNGEIYEGDIVRFVQKDGDEIIFQDIGLVKYHHAAFIVDGSNWGKDDHYLGDYIIEGNQTELEIIGNVTENPEIIEKSNK